MSNAAREAARQAATGQLTNARSRQVASHYLAEAGLTTTNVATTITITDPNGATVTDVSQCNYLDAITITVSIPYSDVRWTLITYGDHAWTDGSPRPCSGFPWSINRIRVPRSRPPADTRLRPHSGREDKLP